MNILDKASECWYERACRVIPGGVNSPVRAFNGVGGHPLFVKSGKGKHIELSGGRRLVDFCCSWGAMILGHAHPEVVEAVARQAELGSSFGIATELEVLFAEKLCSLVPGMERVRAVNSGTEAVMTALRLARGVTNRPVIVKFDGCYHGHADSMLVKAGSGLLTGSIGSSAGVTEGAAKDTVVVPYNDIGAVSSLFEKIGDKIAAVIVEPVAANMGMVPPLPGFLQRLRELTAAHGALLILDEVINAFRFALTTYGATAGIEPDLTTMGKVIGGCLPLAAVGGKARIMDHLAPKGNVYQAGTLSGNPLAVAAGLKTLEILERDNPYPRMAELCARFADRFNSGAAAKGARATVARHRGIFTVFATDRPVFNREDTGYCDTALYSKLFQAALDAGYYLPPSQFEVGFFSAVHGEDDADALADALIAALMD